MTAQYQLTTEPASTIQISVVIPTFQRRAVLGRTLPTIFAQDLPPAQFEVIVVVDGSTDGTADYLQSIERPQCAFRVIQQDNRGQASARNTGLREARGEIVLFLDDDVICEPSLLRDHLEAHRRFGNCIVSGLILPAAAEKADLASDLNAIACERMASTVKSGSDARWPDVACGVNDSAPRSALLAVGGFDERFASMREDSELGMRLWQSGLRVRYQPDAVVHHLSGKSARDLVESDAERYGRSELLLCRTHPEYQQHSPLAALIRGGLIRRGLAEIAARSPFSPEPLLRIPCALTEQLRWMPPMRRLGMRLLRARIAIVGLRSAVREAGSWRALRHEFES
jgi:GT2 family glycosyltransferase